MQMHLYLYIECNAKILSESVTPVLVFRFVLHINVQEFSLSGVEREKYLLFPIKTSIKMSTETEG
jgi:hypothetical protein